LFQQLTLPAHRECLRNSEAVKPIDEGTKRAKLTCTNDDVSMFDCVSVETVSIRPNNVHIVWEIGSWSRFPGGRSNSVLFIMKQPSKLPDVRRERTVTLIGVNIETRMRVIKVIVLHRIRRNGGVVRHRGKVNRCTLLPWYERLPI
jgi:hypothetical protein